MKHRLLYAVSVLPALLVMPAVAKEVTLDGQTTIVNKTNSDANNQEAAGLTIDYGDTFADNGISDITFENNQSVNSGGAMKALNGFTAGDNWSFVGNHSDKISGGLYIKIPNDGNENRNVVFGKNTTFENNDSKWLGGALGIEAANNVTFGSGAKFANNSSLSDGGAIAVWTDSTNESVTTGVTLNLNGATFAGNNANNRGGAIANLNNDTTETAYNNTVNVSNATLEENTAARGGAIYNVGTVNVDKTEFKANYSDGFVKDDFGGGAIWNKGTANIKNSAFSQNYSVFDGGAINNVAGATLSLVNTNFTGNYKNDVETYWGGGAIVNSGSITKIDGGTFLNNHADGTKSYGGAIYVRDSGVVSEITGTRFIGNYSLYHGGALATIENAEITLIKNAYFEGNGVKDYDTEDAVAVTQYGGAFKHGGNHETEIQNSTFINNMATLRGGAIINETSALVKINNNSIFTSNKAEQSGGALYGNFEISDSKFSLNSAVMSGGAMSGYGKISNSVFSENVAGQEAGALVVSSGAMELDNVTFDKNYVNDTYTDKGAPDWHRGGGAIYSQNGLTVKNSSFDGNYAGGVGGAITNWWGGAAKLTATNTDFKNNYSSYGYGGAIFNSETITELTTDSGNVFSNNTAVAGGAIANMSRYNDAKGKSVTIDSIDGYTFENNHAIANDKALIRVAEGADAGKFENASDELRGHIDGMGGAIYNEKVITSMSNVTFTGNTATDFGGAIYNEENGGLTLSGKNTFTGNVADGNGNDIYNAGILTIKDGTTTLNSGLVNSGTFTNADGATLQLGGNIELLSALTNNGTLNFLDGAAVKASGYDGSEWIAGTGTVSGTASLVLDNGFTDGSFKIAGDVAGLKFADNALYDITAGDTGVYTIAKKSAEESVKALADAGVTGNSSAAIVAMAGVETTGNTQADAVLSSITAAVQAGDMETAEKIADVVNPEDTPVVQAVATTVQNQVINLAGNRMAGVTGRNAGDVALTGGGVWAQGLFNKSKMNSEFHSYTRGVSVGIDEVIEHDYTIGLGYAYSTTDVHVNNGRNNDIASNTLFLYGQYKPSDWFINAVAHYSTAQYKESVTSIAKNSKHDVDSFGASVTTGYKFASGATPELGLRYLNVSQDEYTDSFGFKVSAETTELLTSVAGVKYVFDIEATRDWIISPELRAAATYDILSDKGAATVVIPGAAGYVVNSDRLSRVGGEFGIGLSTTYAGVELSVNYDITIHKDYTSQTGLVKARYEF